MEMEEPPDASGVSHRLRLFRPIEGRRIDPGPAGARRFPFGNVPIAENGLRRLFEELGAPVLMTSAACGTYLHAQSRGGSRRCCLFCERFESHAGQT